MPNRLLLSSLKYSFRIVHSLDKRKTDFSPSEVHNILIINTTSIGDTLLSTPAIRAIRQGFPDTKIVVLASNPAKKILLNNPRINKIIEHPRRVDFFYLFKLPRLLQKIRSDSFDLVVILHANDPDAAPLAYLSGAPHRFGWAESKLAFLHTIPVRTRVPGMHIIDTRLKNLEALGIKADDKRMEVFLSNKEKVWSEKFLNEYGLNSGKFIGIHPFGSKKNKWWPYENVVEFCQKVISKFNLSIIIFGGEKERPFAKMIAKKVKRVSTVAGRLDIRESAALIERCEVFITTDSGPMHIAQALGVPTIVLFGPDDPIVTGPLTKPYEIIRKDLSCIPCRLKTCDRGMICMKQITSEDVIRAIKHLPVESKGAIRLV